MNVFKIGARVSAVITRANRIFFHLQSAIKFAGKNNVKKLHSLLSIVDEKPIKVENIHNDHHIKNHFKHNHYSHNSILAPNNQVIQTVSFIIQLN